MEGVPKGALPSMLVLFWVIVILCRWYGGGFKGGFAPFDPKVFKKKNGKLRMIPDAKILPVPAFVPHGVAGRGAFCFCCVG